MSHCIFTKIINKEIPADIVFENEKILAFKDIQPQAPIHILFIHKIKTVDLRELFKHSGSSLNQIHEIFLAIKDFTEQENITDFRIVNNCGLQAGQSVFYTHFHLLAGKKLSGRFT